MDSSVAGELQRLSREQSILEHQRMLQALLADRFKLTLHRETKEFLVYALIVGKNGPKNLQASESGDGPSTQLVDGELIFKGTPMSHFAAMLQNRPPAGINERVVDK